MRTESLKTKFTWPDLDRIVWLNPIDAYVVVNLTDKNSLIVEIGVYKGGWSLTEILNVPGVKVYGIDPYPGLQHIKLQLQDHIRDSGLENNFRLFENHKDLLHSHGDIRQKIQVIHIDGEHTEEAVMKDLKFSASILKDSGLIVIDDFFDRRFPGVSAASLDFLKIEGYSIFLITDQKAYICKNKHHSFYKLKLIEILERGKVVYSSGFEEGSFGEKYSQSNSVLGFSNILIRGRDNSDFVSSIYSTPGYINHSIKKVLNFIIPPVIILPIKYFLRLLKL
jgi:hypothetical protein